MTPMRTWLTLLGCMLPFTAMGEGGLPKIAAFVAGNSTDMQVYSARKTGSSLEIGASGHFGGLAAEGFFRSSQFLEYKADTDPKKEYSFKGSAYGFGIRATAHVASLRLGYAFHDVTAKTPAGAADYGRPLYDGSASGPYFGVGLRAPLGEFDIYFDFNRYRMLQAELSADEVLIGLRYYIIR